MEINLLKLCCSCSGTPWHFSVRRQQARDSTILIIPIDGAPAGHAQLAMIQDVGPAFATHPSAERCDSSGARDSASAPLFSPTLTPSVASKWWVMQMVPFRSVAGFCCNGTREEQNT